MQKGKKIVKILVDSILSSSRFLFWYDYFALKSVFVQYVANAMSSKWTMSSFGYQSDTRFTIRKMIFSVLLLSFLHTKNTRTLLRSKPLLM